MQVHNFDFVVDGTPDEVWDVIWKRTRVGIKTDTVTIEIYHPGDEEGNGLVRHCYFPVPKYLLSKGRAQSWEWITEAQRPVSWRYDAVGKPLWSRASGLTRLEDLGGGRPAFTSARPTRCSTRSCGRCSRNGCTTSSPRTTTS